MNQIKVSVVIPCYRVKKHIADVISRIGPEVIRVYAVDDCCPEQSGDFIFENIADPRVVVLRNSVNLGVGGAMKTGYRQALLDGMDIIIKIDGDGQMDPSLIPIFSSPIQGGEADYVKGNRFYDLTHISQMPYIRIFGNSVLSFMTKLSTGYWNVFDVNNGFVAIHANVLSHINLEKVSDRYFFESDMLYQIGLLRGRVVDIPMDALYADEESNLKIKKIFFEFLYKHIRNFSGRIFYNYFLRDFSIASIELSVGTLFFAFGSIYGAAAWFRALTTFVPTPVGTIMLSALTLILGLQFIISFINYDISSVPLYCQHLKLLRKKFQI
jgi:glycosyltransferase involved in cell wall biosynthesis